MKTVKKLACATAIASATAALPAMGQGLVPLGDTDMSNVTGQAGVTIEMDANVNIDRVAYSQNDGGQGQGALLVDNIRLSGWQNGTDTNGNPTYDNLELKVDIDIAANGDAIIKLANRASADPFKVGLGIDKIGLGTNMSDPVTTTLISNLEVEALVGTTTITATNNNPFAGGGDTGSLVIESSFAVNNLEADVDMVAMKLRDVRVAASGNLDTLKSGGTITDSMLATNTVTIGSGSRLSEADPSNPTNPLALRMSVGDSNLDVWMGDVQIGGKSVGSVAIQGLSMAGTEIAVYGRD